MRAIEVAQGIHWVGAIDWDLRDFHGYGTSRGTSYNAYLVVGSDKVALVDTVKGPFVGELLSRIATVVDPGKIDLIVVNHVEPDHNGGLPQVMQACPNARVVASSAGVKGVADYHGGLAIEKVGKDDEIDLGGLSLRFLPMPMVHWPDSMFTYCPERSVLMPNDAFGQHLASSDRFADELGHELALDAAEEYFANILMPLIPQVGKAVAKVVETGWPIETIAPSHGVIWRGADSVGAVLAAYGRWLEGPVSSSVTIVYSTMWDSTRALAHATADGVAESGATCRVFDLADSSIGEITHYLFNSRALLLGSPTLHHGMLYRVSGYLTYLEGLRPIGRIAGVFGSYGWGGGATKQMRERLEGIGLEVLDEELTAKFRPEPDDLERAREWGRSVGEKVLGQA